MEAENNKLIAEFMGGKLVDKFYPGVFRYEGLTDRTLIYPSDLKYHSSWDWLMPVVAKIKNMKLGDKNLKYRLVAFSLSAVDIYETYTSVVQFIKWYNQQPK